jgi:hypothetical protein
VTYEIWTTYRYGAMFGEPETKLEDGLSEQQVAEWLRQGHGRLLHTLLVVQRRPEDHDDGDQKTRASKWLANYEKGK